MPRLYRLSCWWFISAFTLLTACVSGLSTPAEPASPRNSIAGAFADSFSNRIYLAITVNDRPLTYCARVSNMKRPDGVCCRLLRRLLLMAGSMLKPPGAVSTNGEDYQRFFDVSLMPGIAHWPQRRFRSDEHTAGGNIYWFQKSSPDCRKDRRCPATSFLAFPAFVLSGDGLICSPLSCSGWFQRLFFDCRACVIRTRRSLLTLPDVPVEGPNVFFTLRLRGGGADLSSSK